MHEPESEYDPNTSRQWVWDNQSNTLVLVEPHIEKQKQRAIAAAAPVARVSPIPSGDQCIEYKTKFLDAIDPVEQLKFRRHFMRKTKPHEVDVVTLQDVKDVVFYLLITPVPVDFIKFFHTPEVDNYLRALILYFQYFLEIWEDVLYRQTYGQKRLKHPIGQEREMAVRDLLGQLRCIVARDYSLLLLGSGNCKRFHHMANKQRKSIAERDLKLFEQLHVFSTRVVWVALNRQNLSVIERELHRLFRSDYFSRVNQKTKPSRNAVPNEKDAFKRNILDSWSKKERQFFVRSPAVREVSVESKHPHELLLLGIIPVSVSNERLVFFQDAYTLTEEYLESNEISVGILGHSRDSYEPLLQPKEKLIGPVKRYKISSSLPGIFPGRVVHHDSTEEPGSITSQHSYSSKESPSDKEGQVGEETEEVQIIVRSKDYYKELHKQRIVVAKKMWLKTRSISATKVRHDSKIRKYSATLCN